MDRMHELTPEELDAPNRELAERIVKTRGGKLQGPWSHMMRNPGLAERAAAYSDYLREGVSVPKKLGLLGIIMAARHWNAGFVWAAQSPQAKNAGVPEAVIEAIRAKKTPTFSDPAEKAVYELFNEFYTKQTVSDATYSAAQKVLGDTGIVEILNIAGFYSIIASIVRVTGIQPKGQPDPFAS